AHHLVVLLAVFELVRIGRDYIVSVTAGMLAIGAANAALGLGLGPVPPCPQGIEDNILLASGAANEDCLAALLHDLQGGVVIVVRRTFRLAPTPRFVPSPA